MIHALSNCSFVYLNLLTCIQLQRHLFTKESFTKLTKSVFTYSSWFWVKIFYYCYYYLYYDHVIIIPLLTNNSNESKQLFK